METVYGRKECLDIFLCLENKKQSETVLMNDYASSSKHSWSSIDGSSIETTTTFPPFKGIVIGEAPNSAKAIPLVQKDDNAHGIDNKI